MCADRITGGLAGKILNVDLNHASISIENTEKYAERFVVPITVLTRIYLISSFTLVMYFSIVDPSVLSG